MYAHTFFELTTKRFCYFWVFYLSPKRVIRKNTRAKKAAVAAENTSHSRPYGYRWFIFVDSMAEIRLCGGMLLQPASRTSIFHTNNMCAPVWNLQWAWFPLRTPSPITRSFRQTKITVQHERNSIYTFTSSEARRKICCIELGVERYRIRESCENSNSLN